LIWTYDEEEDVKTEFIFIVISLALQRGAKKYRYVSNDDSLLARYITRYIKGSGLV